MKALYCLRIIVPALALLAELSALAQEQREAMQHSPGATSLASLIEEAKAKSPQILAANHAYKAASHAPASAAALPDTQVMVQHLSVGSPRPFAGYTNSDFAYIGLGISQELPYPGKRKLRAEVAGREAETVQAQAASTARDVIERIKTTYFRLAYVQQSIHVLEHHDQVLAQMQQVAESRYRVGQGNQQEVLKAQLQHTKILQEITMSRRDEGQLEAQLKQLAKPPARLARHHRGAADAERLALFRSAAFAACTGAKPRHSSAADNAQSDAITSRIGAKRVPTGFQPAIHVSEHRPEVPRLLHADVCRNAAQSGTPPGRTRAGHREAREGKPGIAGRSAAAKR